MGLSTQNTELLEEKELLNQQLQDAAQALTNSKAEVSAQLLQLEQTEQLYQDKTTKLATELSELQEVAKAQSEEKQQLQTRLTELEAEEQQHCDNLKQMMSQLGGLEAAGETYLIEKEQMETQLMQLDQGFADATQYANDLQEQIVSHVKQITQMKEQRLELSDEKLALDQQLSIVQQTLQATQQRTKEEQQQMETVNMKLTTHNADLADERAALEAEVLSTQQSLHQTEQLHKKEWQQREAQMQQLDQGFRTATHTSNDLKKQLEADASAAVVHRAAVLEQLRNRHTIRSTQQHSALRQWVSRARLCCLQEQQVHAEAASHKLLVGLQEAKLQLAMQEASYLHIQAQPPQPPQCRRTSVNANAGLIRLAHLLSQKNNSDKTIARKNLRILCALQLGGHEARAKSTSPRLRHNAAIESAASQPIAAVQNAKQLELRHRVDVCTAARQVRAAPDALDTTSPDATEKTYSNFEFLHTPQRAQSSLPYRPESSPLRPQRCCVVAASARPSAVFRFTTARPPSVSSAQQ